MKYVKQFLIIAGITLIGEILNELIPAPIPASIYGIIILFALLQIKVIPLSSVKEAGDFLISVMPITFVPPAVEVVQLWGIISDSFVAYVVLIFVSTLLVMAVSGWITQILLKRGSKNE